MSVSFFFKFLWPSQEQMNFNSGSLARWTKLEPGEMEIFNFLWLIWDYRDQGGLSFYAGAKDKYVVVPNNSVISHLVPIWSIEPKILC